MKRSQQPLEKKDLEECIATDDALHSDTTLRFIRGEIRNVHNAFYTPRFLMELGNAVEELRSIKKGGHNLGTLRTLIDTEVRVRSALHGESATTILTQRDGYSLDDWFRRVNLYVRANTDIDSLTLASIKEQVKTQYWTENRRKTAEELSSYRSVLATIQGQMRKKLMKLDVTLEPPLAYLARAIAKNIPSSTPVTQQPIAYVSEDGTTYSPSRRGEADTTMYMMGRGRHRHEKNGARSGSETPTRKEIVTTHPEASSPNTDESVHSQDTSNPDQHVPAASPAPEEKTVRHLAVMLNPDGTDALAPPKEQSGEFLPSDFLLTPEQSNPSIPVVQDEPRSTPPALPLEVQMGNNSPAPHKPQDTSCEDVPSITPASADATVSEQPTRTETAPYLDTSSVDLPTTIDETPEACAEREQQGFDEPYAHPEESNAQQSHAPAPAPAAEHDTDVVPFEEPALIEAARHAEAMHHQRTALEEAGLRGPASEAALPRLTEATLAAKQQQAETPPDSGEAEQQKKLPSVIVAADAMRVESPPSSPPVRDTSSQTPDAQTPPAVSTDTSVASPITPPQQPADTKESSVHEADNPAEHSFFNKSAHQPQTANGETLEDMLVDSFDPQSPSRTFRQYRRIVSDMRRRGTVDYATVQNVRRGVTRYIERDGKYKSKVGLSAFQTEHTKFNEYLDGICADIDEEALSTAYKQVRAKAKKKECTVVDMDAATAVAREASDHASAYALKQRQRITRAVNTFQKDIRKQYNTQTKKTSLSVGRTLAYGGIAAALLAAVTYFAVTANKSRQEIVTQQSNGTVSQQYDYQPPAEEPLVPLTSEDVWQQSTDTAQTDDTSSTRGEETTSIDEVVTAQPTPAIIPVPSENGVAEEPAYTEPTAPAHQATPPSRPTTEPREQSPEESASRRPGERENDRTTYLTYTIKKGQGLVHAVRALYGDTLPTGKYARGRAEVLFAMALAREARVAHTHAGGKEQGLYHKTERGLRVGPVHPKDIIIAAPNPEAMRQYVAAHERQLERDFVSYKRAKESKSGAKPLL